MTSTYQYQVQPTAARFIRYGNTVLPVNGIKSIFYNTKDDNTEIEAEHGADTRCFAFSGNCVDVLVSLLKWSLSSVEVAEFQPETEKSEETPIDASAN